VHQSRLTVGCHPDEYSLHNVRRDSSAVQKHPCACCLLTPGHSTGPMHTAVIAAARTICGAPQIDLPSGSESREGLLNTFASCGWCLANSLPQEHSSADSVLWNNWHVRDLSTRTDNRLRSSTLLLTEAKAKGSTALPDLQTAYGSSLSLPHLIGYSELAYDS